jgi:hypothetical protein
VTTRRERVVLELEDNFTAGAARAAAATALLKRELDGLNGGASGSGIDNLGKEVEGLGKKTRKTKEDVDGLGDGLGKTKQKTKEFTLEQAIAAEKVSPPPKGAARQAKAAVDAEQGISASRTRRSRAARRSTATRVACACSPMLRSSSARPRSSSAPASAGWPFRLASPASRSTASATR